MNFSKDFKISQTMTISDGAAGTTAITGATLDMQGYDGVIFIITFGAIVSGAVTSIKAQQGEASNMSDAADLLGSGQTIADTDDNKTFFIDLYKPSDRYVRALVSRATQNATVQHITAIQYKGSKLPVPAHGTDVAGELHISPAEGTA